MSIDTPPPPPPPPPETPVADPVDLPVVEDTAAPAAAEETAGLEGQAADAGQAAALSAEPDTRPGQGTDAAEAADTPAPDASSQDTLPAADPVDLPVVEDTAAPAVAEETAGLEGQAANPGEAAVPLSAEPDTAPGQGTDAGEVADTPAPDASSQDTLRAADPVDLPVVEDTAVPTEPMETADLADASSNAREGAGPSEESMDRANAAALVDFQKDLDRARANDDADFERATLDAMSKVQVSDAIRADPRGYLDSLSQIEEPETPRPVVIGEQQDRVEYAAERFGAETYPGLTAEQAGLEEGSAELKAAQLEHNNAWINQMRDEGRLIIDTGPAEPRGQYPKPTRPSDWPAAPYEIELGAIENYPNVIRPWEGMTKAPNFPWKYDSSTYQDGHYKPDQHRASIDLTPIGDIRPPTTDTVGHDAADRPIVQDPDHSAVGSSDGYKRFDDAPVLPSSPNVDTVHQGILGDCWAISAVNAVSHAEPGVWENRIHDNGDSVTVDLYDNGQLSPVTVDKTLPVDVKGNLVAARDTDHSTFGSFVEKALAVKLGNGSYKGIVGGFPHRAMETLTGRRGQDASPDKVGPDQLKTLVDGHHPVCAGSVSDRRLDAATLAERHGPNGGDLDLIPRQSEHTYTVTSIGDDGRVELRNPWGYNHLSLSWDQFKRNFDYVGWC